MTNPLKSLQKLARKKKALLSFEYYEWRVWVGVLFTEKRLIKAHDTNFTTMLQKLYKEVKKI